MGVPIAVAALAGAILCYGASSLLLATGSHAVRGRAYLTGLAFQAAAFLLAFLARIDLPLLLVQSAVAASVAVTASAGAVLGRWRLLPRDVAALGAVVAGIALVAGASRPGRAEPVSQPPVLIAAAVALLTLAGLAVRLRPSLLGALAGLAYGSSAIAARMLAADPLAAVHTPAAAAAAIVLVGGVLIGQVLLTVAFRRSARHPDDDAAAPTAPTAPAASGSVTGPVAALYIASTLWPSAAGLAWLGDRVQPGRAPLAALGIAAALAGTAVLSRHERG